MHEHLTDIVDLGLKEHCSSTDKRIRQLRPLLYVRFTLKNLIGRQHSIDIHIYTLESLWVLWLVESIQSTYNSVWSWHNNPICDINYGVLQGFPVLRKAVTTHVIKYCILLYVFGITIQLPSHYLPLAPFGRVDEWMAKPLPFSIYCCLSAFFRIMAAKHSNLSIAFRQQCSNFPEGEENQNTKSKTESYVFSG